MQGAEITRREAIAGLAAAGATLTRGTEGLAQPSARGTAVTITCFIRYQIDPFQREEFKKYAEAWGRIIPRCGGHLLASYETYRARLRTDPEAKANFAAAQSKRFVLREERNFVEVVDGTFELPSTPKS